MGNGPVPKVLVSDYVAVLLLHAITFAFCPERKQVLDHVLILVVLNILSKSSLLISV